MNKGSVLMGLMKNSVHQKGVTAPAGGKYCGGQKSGWGGGQEGGGGTGRWASLVEKDASEHRPPGGQEGREETFGSPTTLFLVLEKTEQLFPVHYVCPAP